MSLSDRDRKIVLIIVPVVLVVAYWFLLLAPKREAAATAKADAGAQVERRDAAKAQLDQASSAKTDFAADYGEIVRLGKAIPAKVDMPSLLVQLEGAAEGTGIRFTRIGTGDRTVAPVPAPADGAAPADGQAQSPAGTAADQANGAVAASDGSSTAAEQSGVDAQTSTSTGQGGLPVGGGAGAPTAPGAAPVAPTALDTVPLELEFTGDFFNLADFFHDVKRFVHVANTDVLVNGRLVTVGGVSFSSDPELFPRIRASLTATIYLSPKVQGATAGATPQGPPTTTPAATGTTPAPATSPSPAPTAAATP